MWGGWTVSSLGKGAGNFQSRDVPVSWFAFAVMIRRPFASAGRPRLPVGLVASGVFFPPLFQFYIWLSHPKCLLLVWAPQRLRIWKPELRYQCLSLCVLLIPVTLWDRGLPHVQSQSVLSLPLFQSSRSPISHAWAHLLGGRAAGGEEAIGRGVEGHGLVQTQPWVWNGETLGDRCF